MKLEVAERKCTLHMSQDQAPCYFPTRKVDSHLVNSQVWKYLLKHRTHLQAIWEVPWVSEYCSLKSNVSFIVVIEHTREQRGFMKSLHSSNSPLFPYIYSPGSITFCFDSCQKLNERYLGKGGLSYRRNSCGFLFVTHMLSVTSSFFLLFQIYAPCICCASCNGDWCHPTYATFSRKGFFLTFHLKYSSLVIVSCQISTGAAVSLLSPKFKLQLCSVGKEFVSSFLHFFFLPR